MGAQAFKDSYVCRVFFPTIQSHLIPEGWIKNSSSYFSPLPSNMTQWRLGKDRGPGEM